MLGQEELSKENSNQETVKQKNDRMDTNIISKQKKQEDIMDFLE